MYSVIKKLKTSNNQLIKMYESETNWTDYRKIYKPRHCVFITYSIITITDIISVLCMTDTHA